MREIKLLINENDYEWLRKIINEAKEKNIVLFPVEKKEKRERIDEYAIYWKNKIKEAILKVNNNTNKDELYMNDILQVMDILGTDKDNQSIRTMCGHYIRELRIPKRRINGIERKTVYMCKDFININK